MSSSSEPSIGLIGMGEMGTMYAQRLLAAGWTKIYVCDRAEKYEELKKKWEGTALHVVRDGHHVSRISDYILYSVEAEYIDRVVAEYGPSTKVGSIVSGQTSVKAPEKVAFEKHLPSDVAIVSIHSLHGPSVSPEGQPMVLIQHRATNEQLALVERIFKSFKSYYVYLSYEEHDLVTANTQAVTHAAFLSMGTAWHASQGFPWSEGRYTSGIEVIKINIALRIYSNKWHVYAGLAILNPSARLQIDQYAKSVTELFKMFIQNEGKELRERVYSARKNVFGFEDNSENSSSSTKGRAPILLNDEILNQFSLGPKPSTPHELTAHPRNSHLSLLAMVDCWSILKIQPFQHLDLAATPLFRMWIGVAEYLFRDTAKLNEAIDAALTDLTHRSDDTEFVIAARGWSQCISFGSFEMYRDRFERTASFFTPQFPEATKVGGEMLKVISALNNQKK